MAAPPSPPHRSRRPELRHSATRGCQVLSPHPASLSDPAAPPAASARSAGPLWRSPHDQRFGPSPCTHPPVGRPRPPPSSPRLKRLNIPAAAPPVSRTGAANGSAALPASPPPARPAPHLVFSIRTWKCVWRKAGPGGGRRCYPRSNRDTHATPRKTTRRSPVLSPPPPLRAVTWLCFPHVATHTPPPPPCRDSAPRTCRAASPPPPTRRVLPGVRGKRRSVLPPRGKQRDAGAAPERNKRGITGRAGTVRKDGPRSWRLRDPLLVYGRGGSPLLEEAEKQQQQQKIQNNKKKNKNKIRRKNPLFVSDRGGADSARAGSMRWSPPPRLTPPLGSEAIPPSRPVAPPAPDSRLRAELLRGAAPRDVRWPLQHYQQAASPHRKAKGRCRQFGQPLVPRASRCPAAAAGGAGPAGGSAAFLRLLFRLRC
ncbi:uncharacterized protein LOC135301516 [Passer domesticus]|uniref:uncharacterized protein LOC135301516 n=1 Tax=Passer domesticus TaxID=48849 RepID=UPI0030FDF80B